MNLGRNAFKRIGVVVVVAVVVGLSGCSGSGSSGTTPPSGYVAGKLDRSNSGTELTVLMPPWGQMPKKLLAEFTSRTGVKVSTQSLDFDTLHDKIVTTEASGRAPADVVEMDATWVSQFGAAKWMTPLKGWLSPSLVTSMTGSPSFVYRGDQVAIPYSLDFRGMTVNMTLLKSAGITQPPETWDEVIADGKALRGHGVEYPVGLPLSATEGSSTPWYALMRASSASILSSTGAPRFDTATGVASLEFYHRLYADQLIDPGSVGLTDSQVVDNFSARVNAIQLSSAPGQLGVYSQSGSPTEKDDIRFVHVPTKTGALATSIGLQEGLAIPKASAHKAAAAQFISWWEQRANLETMYLDPKLGNLPPLKSALDSLNSQGKLAGGDGLLKLLSSVGAIVQGGTPTWYPKFSANVAQMLQSAALGKTDPQSALDRLKSTTKGYASGSG